MKCDTRPPGLERSLQYLWWTSMTAVAFVASIGSVRTDSRLTWSLARDDAMPLSRWLKRTNDDIGVSVWALLFNGFWLSIGGCVHLVSSSGEPLSLTVWLDSSIETQLTECNVQRLRSISHDYWIDIIQLSSGSSYVARAKSEISTHDKPIPSRQVGLACQRTYDWVNSSCIGDIQLSGRRASRTRFNE